MEHQSVLKAECLELLAIKPEGIYVDMTLGRAGHASAILSKLTSGHLYGFDKDETAIAESDGLLAKISSNYTLFSCDFSEIKEKLEECEVRVVDGILMDLGVSSPQFDDISRGFSYKGEARLDMRMDRRQRLSAYEVVNEYPLADLTKVLREYGEEPFAYPIAKAIVAKRPLTTTTELVAVIKEVLPAKVLAKKGHPAKQVFQAIRLEVNGELEALKSGLDQALDLLKPSGRLAIISFHSLEDRLIKVKFNEVSKVIIDKRIPLKAREIPQATFKLVNRKVIMASEAEVKINNRAAGAKLRVIERIGDDYGY